MRLRGTFHSDILVRYHGNPGFNCLSISIHPLLAERDDTVLPEIRQEVEFQSTRSSRSGTRCRRYKGSSPDNFNPPAPRGAGPDVRDPSEAGRVISIHPLLAERDKRKLTGSLLSRTFQSTRSSRSGTTSKPGSGGDFVFQSTRSSRSGTKPMVVILVDFAKFQSTRSSRSGTICRTDFRAKNFYFNPPAPRGAGQCVSGIRDIRAKISIHPLLAERDDL